MKYVVSVVVLNAESLKDAIEKAEAGEGFSISAYEHENEEKE